MKYFAWNSSQCFKTSTALLSIKTILLLLSVFGVDCMTALSVVLLTDTEPVLKSISDHDKATASPIRKPEATSKRQSPVISSLVYFSLGSAPIYSKNIFSCSAVRCFTFFSVLSSLTFGTITLTQGLSLTSPRDKACLKIRSTILKYILKSLPFPFGLW